MREYLEPSRLFPCAWIYFDLSEIDLFCYAEILEQLIEGKLILLLIEFLRLFLVDCLEIFFCF